MNTYNFDVNFTTGRIYGPDLLLVVNDHNSTTFKFTFDQEGRYVFKLLYPDNTIYVQDIIDGELVLTKGVLNQEGNYKFEISLYGDDNRLTTARIKEFPVRLELVETDEPVQADDRLPILDNLIEETNKVVEAAKNGEFDGATFTPSVSDNGDLSWTNDKGKENPPTVNIKGEKGDPGAVKMQVVDTLPQVGDTDTIYLLKKDTPGEQNLYDEYVYTEASGWEHIGDTSVDLTNYYTKEETNEKLNTKQDALTAGNNITIENNVISASGGSDGIPIFRVEISSMEGGYAFGLPGILLSDDEKLQIQNIINKGLNEYLIEVYFTNQGIAKQKSYLFHPYYKNLESNPTAIQFNMFAPMYYTSASLKESLFTITGNWDNGIFTCTSAKIYKNVSYDIATESNVLFKTNTTSYTPTQPYHPSTKKYVDTSIVNLNNDLNETIASLPTHQELIDNGFDYLVGTIEKQVNYTVENISTDYGFELNANEYYESNNKGVKSSYSLCKVIFNNEQSISIPISYINSGESNYDYGIFGNIDQILSSSNSDDGATGSEKVFKNCKGESLPDVKEIVYEIPAGEHFIYIKYRKDNSGNNDNDSLQFKIPSTFQQGVYENRKMATTKYVDDSIATLPSLPIYDFKMTSPFTKYNPPSTYQYMSDIDKTTLQTIIQNAYSKGLDSIVLIARQKYGSTTGTNEQTQDYLLTTTNRSQNLIKNKPTTLTFNGYNHGSMTISDNHLSRLSIAFTLKWSGDTCTVGHAQYINMEIDIATKTDYQTYVGYDATKTQVLKNVNGTLTWVDEA